MTKFDLHMHSEVSPDGELSVGQLLDMAQDKGLEVIALSDHDTVRAVSDMMEEGEKRHIRVIPAIECSTQMGESSVHVLGYGVSLDDDYLNSLEAQLRKKSDDAFGIRVDKLEQKYGIHVNREEIIEKAQGKNPWFTLIDEILTDPKIQAHPDFAPYLPGGSRCDPAPVNFFWDKCQAGSDLFVDAGYPDFFMTIGKIHDAGGLAILAHPFKTFYKREDLLKKAMEHGLDGIEVYSNYHNDEQTKWYLDFAKNNGLLITCGSDFHGEKKPSIEMGEYHIEEDGTPYLQALDAALAAGKYRKTTQEQ